MTIAITGETPIAKKSSVAGAVATDYCKLSDEDLVAFIITHQKEFAGDWNVEIDDFKHAIYKRFDYGFAILFKNEWCGFSLGFFWVDPSKRGRRIGKTYMRILMSEYADTYYMTLHCHKCLRAYYGSLGFRVIESQGDKRTMQGPYSRGERVYR